MPPENIDYKKLLKMCMTHWFDAEGCCWDGDSYDNFDNPSKLSNAEKKQ